MRIHVHARRGAKLRATVAGTAVPVRSGEVVVDLRNRKAGRYRVVVRDAKGRVLTERILRTCVA